MRKVALVVLVGAIASCGGNTVSSTGSNGAGAAAQAGGAPGEGGGTGNGAGAGAGASPGAGGASAGMGSGTGASAGMGSGMGANTGMGTGTGASTGTGAGTGGGPGASGGAVSGTAPIDGVWTGYIESYMFPSTSDALEMTLTVSGSVVTGTMVFGNPALAPPPATDPNVGYPPGFGTTFNEAGFAGEGFTYTMLNGTFDGVRLKMGVATDEVWTTWCTLQTSYLQQQGSDAYGCLPNWGFSTGAICSQPDPMTNMDVPVDCGKLALCTMFQVCLCTAPGCTVSNTMADTTFDMQIAGTKADGSTTGVFQNHNVHFIQSP